MFTLLPFQSEAKAAFYRHLETREDNPCVVIPTGGGKTYFLASVCHDCHTLWQGRVMVLTHVRELLQQAKEKLLIADPTLPVGIYSAGLRLRQRLQPITVAGIQSVYDKAHIFEPFDLIIVDECHRIPADGEGMYRKFLKDVKIINPNVRGCGLTATPYRLDCGEICGKDNLLNEVCFEVSVRELMRDGYLCKVKTRKGCMQADMSGVHTRAGEFKNDEMAVLFNDNLLVQKSCEEIVSLSQSRKGVLVFCCNVAHGEHVTETLRGLNAGNVEFICGETPSDERASIIQNFKAQRTRLLVNVNVLTEGFDATHIDCVALLRATLSPGLYYQMVGRGFRLHDGKDDCLILDYGTNIDRHGPVDLIRRGKKPGTGTAPMKECPECHLQIPAGCTECPECSFALPREERRPNHGTTASGEPIISGEVTIEKHEVKGIRYGLHIKRGTQPGQAPPTLRVDYDIGYRQLGIGLPIWQSEWVCIEHEGFAHTKAQRWWQERTTLPMPETVEAAVALAQAGCLATPISITVKKVSGERFETITHAEILEKFTPSDSWEPPGQREDEWGFVPPNQPSSNSTPPAQQSSMYREDEIPF